MKYFSYICIFLFSLSVGARDYLPGEVWEYKTRSKEGDSTFMVLKVEEYDDLGEVIHIRVDGINMINPLKGNEIINIPHMPFKKSAIDASAVNLVSKNNPIPDFSDGYKSWKQAYSQENAGAFKLSIKDALNAMLGAEWVEQE